MAGLYLEDLTELTAPDELDVLYVVDSPSGAAVGRKVTLANIRRLLNEEIMSFGTGQDVAFMERSTSLAANTADAGAVLVGTPVSQAIAADSMMISNRTANGDFAFYGNLGGNSIQWLFYDTSASRTYLRPNGTTGLDLVASTATINYATSSTSTSTGALVVTGGLGVGGAGYFGGILQTEIVTDQTWNVAVEGAGLVMNMSSLVTDGQVFMDWRVAGGDSDYDFRFLRGTGANGNLTLTNRGTGQMIFAVNNVNELALVSADLAPVTDGGLSLGNSASTFLSIWAEATPTEGTSGEQLTSGGAAGQMTWDAASCLREAKEGIEPWADPKDALDALLGTRIYRFRYRSADARDGIPGLSDRETVYVGPMADEAPWAMHYGGRILNPINVAGFTTLAVQALHGLIQELQTEVATLRQALASRS